MNEEAKSQIPAAEPEITVIPEEFYGGVKKVTPPRAAVSPRAEREVPPVPAQPPPIPPLPKAPAPKVPVPKPTLAAKLQSPPFLLRIFLVIFLLVIIGAAAYYFYQARVARQQLAQPTPPPAPPAEVPPPPPPPPEPPPPPPEPTAVFPAKDYAAAPDSDGDLITDLEENIYGTDPQKPDTDIDGYIDSLEVENLYNPAGFRPERLLPTGLVRVYDNPIFNYSIFYPAGFSAQTLDFTSREVIFASETGEFIEVLVVNNPERLPLLDWYLRAAPGVLSTDLKPFITKQRVEGLVSPDGLTAYFLLADQIYVVTYNIGLRSDANFLTTFKMMLASLRLLAPGETAPEAGAPAAPAEAPTAATPTAP